MKMTKIVFVSEGLIKKEDLEKRKIPQMLDEFKKYGIEFVYTEDYAALNGVGGNMREANLKLEKEGPNWVKSVSYTHLRYQQSDREILAELFYHTVHTVNAKDYTKAVSYTHLSPFGWLVYSF